MLCAFGLIGLLAGSPELSTQKKWEEILVAARVRILGGKVHLQNGDPNMPIEAISLRYTNARDVDLAGFSKLSGLKTLDLFHTSITDDGLKEVSNIHSLEVLELTFTRTTEAGLKHVGKLKNLKVLRLCCTEISPAAIRNLATLGNITELDLNYSTISDVAAVEISRLKSLRVLNLSRTLLTDRGIAALQCPNLKELNLSYLDVDFSGANLAHFEGLTGLALTATHAGDDVIQQITALRNLKILDLSGTHISDKGVQSLTRMTRLTNISVKNCRVTGQCLKDLRAIKSLEYIDLGYTDIKGADLEQLSAAGQVRTLLLDGVKLNVEELTPTLQTLDNLSELSLSNCGIHGNDIWYLKEALPRCNVIK